MPKYGYQDPEGIEVEQKKKGFDMMTCKNKMDGKIGEKEKETIGDNCMCEKETEVAIPKKWTLMGKELEKKTSAEKKIHSECLTSTTSSSCDPILLSENSFLSTNSSEVLKTQNHSKVRTFSFSFDELKENQPSISLLQRLNKKEKEVAGNFSFGTLQCEKEGDSTTEVSTSSRIQTPIQSARRNTTQNVSKALDLSQINTLSPTSLQSLSFNQTDDFRSGSQKASTEMETNPITLGGINNTISEFRELKENDTMSESLRSHIDDLDQMFRGDLNIPDYDLVDDLYDDKNDDELIKCDFSVFEDEKTGGFVTSNGLDVVSREGQEEVFSIYDDAATELDTNSRSNGLLDLVSRIKLNEGDTPGHSPGVKHHTQVEGEIEGENVINILTMQHEIEAEALSRMEARKVVEFHNSREANINVGALKSCGQEIPFHHTRTINFK